MDQIPETAQSYVVCDTESCRNFSQFYCNNCHQRLCDQCKQLHLEKKKNKGHKIVPYQDRKRKVPSEKCRIHPTQDIDVFCEVCQDPLCSTCFAKYHRDHAKCDLETMYNVILLLCKKETTDFWKKDSPGAEKNAESIEEERQNVRKCFTMLRVSMKERADKLKEVDDSILNDDAKKIDEIENSVLNKMIKQQKEADDYMNYLKKKILDYESKMSSIKPTELIKFERYISIAIPKMPNKVKPKLPVFTLGTLNKEEIAKHFGEIEIELESSEGGRKVTMHGHSIYHLSLLPPDKFWAINDFGYLIQSDMEGNTLSKEYIPTRRRFRYIRGNHTVTKEGELLYTDIYENAVYRVTNDMSISKFFVTGNWEPGAIFSSPSNGHILVGTRKLRNKKIIRYNREGRELQDIQWDDKGNILYESIYFIAENINGDICTSDYNAQSVVVVNRSGKYRFSYPYHKYQRGFHPYGICTDVLGHILVCNSCVYHCKNNSSVHLLDINGQFLSYVVKPYQCPPYPCCLCIDNQNDLWVGGRSSSTISVFKYLDTT